MEATIYTVVVLDRDGKFVHVHSALTQEELRENLKIHRAWLVQLHGLQYSYTAYPVEVKP